MDERTVDTMRRRISDYDEISELVFEKLEQMEAECEKNGIPCIVNDGLRTQDEMFCTVKELFHLTKSLRGK